MAIKETTLEEKLNFVLVCTCMILCVFLCMHVYVLEMLPVAGQHGGAGGLLLRGCRAGGVAGETTLCHHPGQKRLVLAHHTGDTHGVIWRERDGGL